MIILDTQHVSQLQRERSQASVDLKARIEASGQSYHITIVTAFEQFDGCLATIRRSTRVEDRARNLDFLAQLLDYYGRDWLGRILPMDQSALSVLQSFSPELIRRIGRWDAQIAAIALSNGALLLSANLRDFRQVPGLIVEDWLRA